MPLNDHFHTSLACFTAFLNLLKDRATDTSGFVVRFKRAVKQVSKGSKRKKSLEEEKTPGPWGMCGNGRSMAIMSDHRSTDVS